MIRLPVTQLQRNLGDISNTLIRGEEIILTRNNKDFARLVPMQPSRIVSKPPVTPQPASQPVTQPKPEEEKSLTDKIIERINQKKGDMPFT